MSDNIMNDRVQGRYFLFLRLTRKLLSELELKDSVDIEIHKLYQAIIFYFNYSDMMKEKVGCGNTNDTKKCALTLYVLNKYKPFYLKNRDKEVSNTFLRYINEYISLYLSFSYFKQKAFRKLFIVNKDMVYLLENYEFSPEQFMIMLDIHYADYNNTKKD
jgi:hypothetical protein